MNMMMNRMPQKGIYPQNRSGVAAATLIGALASAAVKSTLTIKKINEGESSVAAAAKEVAKSTLQGAVATATVASMHAALARPDRSFLSAVTYGTMGVAGIYAIEKLTERFKEAEDA